MSSTKLAQVVLHIQFTQTIQYHNYKQVYSNARICRINIQSTQFNKDISFVFKETFTKEVLKYDGNTKEIIPFSVFLFGLYLRF